IIKAVFQVHSSAGSGVEYRQAGTLFLLNRSEAFNDVAGNGRHGQGAESEIAVVQIDRAGFLEGDGAGAIGGRIVEADRPGKRVGRRRQIDAEVAEDRELTDAGAVNGEGAALSDGAAGPDGQVARDGQGRQR